MPTAKSTKGTTELDQVASETVLDPVMPEGALFVELIPGVKLHVLPPRMWRLSAYRALRQGDVDSWAEGCLCTSADVKILIATDPTTEQFQAFAQRVSDAAEDEGK